MWQQLPPGAAGIWLPARARPKRRGDRRYPHHRRAHELAAASGTQLRLAPGNSPAARIFQLTGFYQLLPIYPDIQQSLHTPPARPGKQT